MAKVFIFLPRSFAEIAHTRLESKPPESRNPTGASAHSRFSTAAMSFSRIFLHAVSKSSSEYSLTVVKSA